MLSYIQARQRINLHDIHEADIIGIAQSGGQTVCKFSFSVMVVILERSLF